jgi:hypothetical protein
MNEQLKELLRGQLNLKWLPKHLNHIAENIKLKNRNVSFLAINALFRQEEVEIIVSPPPFRHSYILRGFVDLQPNDLLRTKAEILEVAFHLDKHNNIIVTTAYSESDPNE